MLNWKTLFCCAVLSLLPEVSGTAWTVSFDNTLTPEKAQALSAGTGPVAGKPFESGSGVFDLDSVAGKKMPAGSLAIIACELEHPRKETVYFGTGADYWFSCFVNGKQVFTTFPQGNPAGTVSKYDTVYPAALEKGKNRIVFLLKRGLSSWQVGFTQLSAGNWPESDAKRQEIFAALQKQVPFQTLCKPWVHRVTPDSASAGAAFSKPVAAGLRWWKHGSEEKHEVWTEIHGQKEARKVHRFDLSGLAPGTGYNYEVLILDESVPEIRTVASGSFTTFPAGRKDCLFHAVSDLQVGETKRIAALDQMVRNCGLGTGDFVVSMGDVDSMMDHFSRIYCSGFISPLQKNGVRCPFVFVRGNHEYRGEEAPLFGEYCGRPYYAFRYGKIFFIVLDTGEDKAMIRTANHFTLKTDTARYMEEQRRFLEKIVRSPECREAQYRIVLAHATPFEFESRYYFAGIRKMAGTVFFGENPPCPLDLWLCGDIHSPYRFDPVKKELAGVYSKKRSRSVPTQEDLKNVRFPVYVNDGPYGAGAELSVIQVRVGDSGIELVCRTPDGKVQDHVLLRKGKGFQVLNTTYRIMGTAGK